jgi:pilus assembly protein Flp/PilA
VPFDRNHLEIRAEAMSKICRFLHSSDAATAVEYAVLLGLILLACITGIMLVGQKTATSYSSSAQSIDNAFQGGS